MHLFLQEGTHNPTIECCKYTQLIKAIFAKYEVILLGSLERELKSQIKQQKSSHSHPKPAIPCIHEQRHLNEVVKNEYDINKSLLTDLLEIYFIYLKSCFKNP